ncbi:MAG: type II toxin-antitoxin system mRNA interferase toxin, RelE/StbE family [Ignavibacteriae bacterium]|nr:type II toxin-antitoxin system mRNA interferase toxin, RelE/StbE family [Ignavibacteriota bacterium]
MRYAFTKQFRRQYQKLPIKLRDQFDERLQLFMADPTLPQLRVHPLKGKYAGYWSMNISGDLRALYLERGDELIIFALIGTHSQLYG